MHSVVVVVVDVGTFIVEHRAPLLHLLLLLILSVVGDVADDLRGVSNAQRLRIVGDLCQLALLFLELGVILHLTLDLGVLRQAPCLGRVHHRGGSRLWAMAASDEIEVSKQTIHTDRIKLTHCNRAAC